MLGRCVCFPFGIVNSHFFADSERRSLDFRVLRIANPPADFFFLFFFLFLFACHLYFPFLLRSLRRQLKQSTSRYRVVLLWLKHVSIPSIFFVFADLVLSSCVLNVFFFRLTS